MNSILLASFFKSSEEAHVFWALIGFAVIGIIVTMFFKKPGKGYLPTKSSRPGKVRK